MITISINDQKFDVPSLELVVDRAEPDHLDLFATEIPRIVNIRLEVDLEPDVDIIKTLGIVRHLTIHMPNAVDKLGNAGHLYPGLEVEFDNAKWVLYRRDFKRNKLHFREII